MRTREQEWGERVAGWRRSGLTAKRFAASIGVNAGTLTHWAWRLGRGQRRAAAVPVRALVEVMSTAVCDERFEVVVAGGRRVHVPAIFDAAALERLLAVLEAER